MVSLGGVHLPLPFILAPMSGIGDLPYRLIAREFGCTLAFAEMVSARALCERNMKTTKLLKSTAADIPLGIQMLAADPHFLVHAVELLDRYHYDVIDLNAACPVRKVTRKGEGAALLKEPAKLSMLVAALVKVARVPVTVKIRSGWDGNSINACDIAKYVEDAGATAVCIHGRTRNQGYGGKADLSIVREVKRSVRIPVIGSGDVFSAEAAVQMMKETGCDGVMVARGALGNPWIFREMAAAYKGEQQPDRPRLDEVVAVMKRHLALSVECHGEIMGIVNFRKFFCWYVKGLRKARALRYQAVRVTGLADMLSLIDGLQTTQWPGSSPGASRASAGGLHRESVPVPSPEFLR
jgi:tRNA-dihydrouridine synthase B